MRLSSSSMTTRLTVAGCSALTTKVARSWLQGMMSIFSPCSSCTTAWTRLPFMPTQAPTGSIELSWLMTPILARRSEEHTSELQSHVNLVCRLLLEKKKNDVCHILSQHFYFLLTGNT